MYHDAEGILKDLVLANCRATALLIFMCIDKEDSVDTLGK